MMINRKIQLWCQENNWTEPRQLENGIWVAFPPGGVIETPLPLELPQVDPPRVNRLEDIINASILIFAAVIVGAIALIVFPFFLAVIVSRIKRRSR